MRQVLALVVGGAALAAAVHGCSGDPALYLGGPEGPIQSLSLSTNRAAIMVGQSVAVGGRGLDAVGNLTADAVTFTSCDGAVVTVGAGGTPEGQFTSFATLTGAGLGDACVLAQAGGLTDTIKVSVGPVGVSITGPDTVGSGNAATFTVVPVDAAGNVLTGTAAYVWSTSNKARLVTDPATGVVAGRSTGTVDMRVVAPGGANATKSVVVAPGVFGGALSASSAAPGVLVTATRAADGPAFDADAAVRLGTVNGWVDQYTADVMTFAVPATGSTAAAVLTLSNMGSDQIAQTTTFTATKAFEDVYGPANLDYSQGPDVDVVKSATGRIYIVQNGLCAGGSGADCDDFFTISAGASARTVKVTLDWVNSAGATGDLDILWVDADFTEYVGNFDGAGSAKPEVSTVTIPANTTWRLWINNYSQTAAQFSNARITLQ